MKLTMRLLVAALALAAAGTASAQINGPATTNGTDMYFYAFDVTSGTSFVEDLGTNMGGFLQGSTAANTGFVDNIAANSTWTTFYNAAAAGDASAATNIQWAIVGGISPNGAVTSNGLATTMTAGDTPVSQTLGTTRSGITVIGQFTSGLAAVLSSAPTTGYYTNDTSADNPLENLGIGGTLNGNIKTPNLNNIGQTSNFYWYSGTKTGAPTAYSNANGNDTFAFDGTNLTFAVPGVVASVPEPSSVAMMLAGLLMVAGVARRRNSK